MRPFGRCDARDIPVSGSQRDAARASKLSFEGVLERFSTLVRAIETFTAPAFRGAWSTADRAWSPTTERDSGPKSADRAWSTADRAWFRATERDFGDDHALPIDRAWRVFTGGTEHRA